MIGKFGDRRANPWTARREAWHLHLDDARDDFTVDHDRVVHSGSLRRLQGKNQILNLGESDFYRTRLTHTLEVARIASNGARHLEGAAGPSRHRDPAGRRPDPSSRA